MILYLQEPKVLPIAKNLKPIYLQEMVCRKYIVISKDGLIQNDASSSNDTENWSYINRLPMPYIFKHKSSRARVEMNSQLHMELHWYTRFVL